MKRLKIVLLQNKYNILVVLSILFTLLLYNSYQSKYTGNEKELIGNIKKISIDGDKLSMVIKAKEKIVANYYFKNEEEKNSFNFELNDKIKVIGSLKKPSNNTIPNTFNYRKYLYSKKIFYTFNANKIELIEKNSNFFYSIKNYFFSKTKSLLTEEYLNTFILGDRSLLGEEYNTYKNLGIIHLFTISGMHVSFIILILKKIKFNNYIILIILLLYLFLIGMQVSVIRSVIMFILSLFRLNIKRINLLKICFSLMLIFNPLFIIDTGFIFTFVMTYGIYKHKDYLNNSYIKNLIILSIITFFCSLPLVINMNYSINILSIFINIIFIPLFTFIIFPLSLLTFFIPILDHIFLFVVDVLKVLTNFINNNSFSISFSKIPLFLILIYYLILFNKNIRVKVLVLVLIILFYFNNNCVKEEVYFIDVGQGDSSLIRFNNKNILIDTGGKTDLVNEEWKKRVRNYKLMDTNISFFKSIGVKKIDYLILTHGDYDHMGEAINLVNNIKIEKVIFNCGEFNDLEKELIKVLDKKKIKYYSCIKELNIDKNKLYFLQTKVYDNENDNSNVIYTELNGYKFMFMGDAGIEKEKDILKKYNISDIDVLKVGHHGSKTSSSKDFINEMNPKYPVISVGKNNRYGHPNKEVLDVLEDSKIYRTDQDGSIMFKIKNNKLEVEICSP